MRHRQQNPPGAFLQEWERVQLETLLHQGEAPVRVIKRALVLSLLDKGKSAYEISNFLDLAKMTPYRIRKKYEQGGLEAALPEPSRPHENRILNERKSVEILAMVCEPPPQGRARWTVRLTTSEAMRRGIVEKITRESIRKLLHEGGLQPWREKNVVHQGIDPVLRGQDGGRSGSL